MAKKQHIPAEIRAHIETTFECCVACGSRDELQAAHKVAESEGGNMAKENFVRLCGACNLTQATAKVIFAEFVQPIPLTMAYGEALETIAKNRKYWAKYCGAARGKTKIKPFWPL